MTLQRHMRMRFRSYKLLIRGSASLAMDCVLAVCVYTPSPACQSAHAEDTGHCHRGTAQGRSWGGRSPSSMFETTTASQFREPAWGLCCLFLGSTPKAPQNVSPRCLAPLLGSLSFSPGSQPAARKGCEHSPHTVTDGSTSPNPSPR